MKAIVQSVVAMVSSFGEEIDGTESDKVEVVLREQEIVKETVKTWHFSNAMSHR